MKRLFLLLMLSAVLLTACENPNGGYRHRHLVKILEDGTVCEVIGRSHSYYSSVYNAGDSVWVNLDTMEIDPRDSTAMMAQIIW